MGIFFISQFFTGGSSTVGSSKPVLVTCETLLISKQGNKGRRENSVVKNFLVYKTLGT